MDGELTDSSPRTDSKSGGDSPKDSEPAEPALQASPQSAASPEKAPPLDKTGSNGLFSKRGWLGTVQTTHCDLIVFAHSFVTGLVDATTFANYGVFVGMQTGNTVILALSTAGLPPSQPYSWLTTLVSIGSFLLGAFTCAQMTYLFGSLRRLTLTADLLSQGLLISLSAIIVSISSVHIPQDNQQTHPEVTLRNPMIVAPIPALAFQSGMQIVTAKLMGVEEVPINVVTSLYAGLMSDKDLLVWRRNGQWTWGWHSQNYKRTRRLVAVVCILSGALCAAWILKKGPGIVLCLWLAAGVKIITALLAGLLLPSVAVEKGKSTASKV